MEGLERERERERDRILQWEEKKGQVTNSGEEFMSCKGSTCGTCGGTRDLGDLSR